METVKISKGFRITIPKSIRESMKLKPGDEFHIYVKEDKIVLVRKRAISDLKGKFKGLKSDDLREDYNRI